MQNCFTYTFKKLKNLGLNIPIKWKNYDAILDSKVFIRDYQYFLKNKLHYKYFESFCSYVNEAKENDIIIDDKGIGIAINKFKYMTIKDKTGLSSLCNIEKDQKILRVNNG